MAGVVFVDGRFVDEADAVVSVFDRGFLFGDGVYEVTAVVGGELIDNARHLARLERSLGEMRIPMPLPPVEIETVQKELVARNELVEGAVYLQVSRGSAERDFSFAGIGTPTLVVFTQARVIVDQPVASRGLKVRTTPETRWARRDIKTTQLVAASLAKQAALDDGYDDAWFVEDGFVTEGTSNNAYIVTAAGEIVTRELGFDILPGVTRRTLVDVIESEHLTLVERPFTVDEAQAAAEAFVTSATATVLPVVEIDGVPVGDGLPGPFTTRLRRLYLDRVVPNV